MCVSSNYIMGAKVAQSIIHRDRNSRTLSNFNGKSMTRDAVSGNNLALCWCWWLLQSMLHIRFAQKTLTQRQFQFLPQEIERVSLSNQKNLLEIIELDVWWCWVVLGLPMMPHIVSQYDNLHTLFNIQLNWGSII